jgi:hypothetical protein
MKNKDKNKINFKIITIYLIILMDGRIIINMKMMMMMNFK